MSDHQTTHFYGDGCHPAHVHARGPCERFMTAYITHAHDLGHVQCVNCGWYYNDHQSDHREKMTNESDNGEVPE